MPGEWRNCSLGPERQKKVIDILEVALITAEQVAIALAQHGQQPAIPPVPEWESDPAPQ